MTFKFSDRSWERLRTCDPALQSVIVHAMGYQVMDFTVLEGHRSLERQRELYDTNRSKTMNSRHLTDPSQAVDIAPYPIDWSDIYRFYALGGIVMAAAKERGVPIRWGGDWDSDWFLAEHGFKDPGHFELKD